MDCEKLKKTPYTGLLALLYCLLFFPAQTMAETYVFEGMWPSLQQPWYVLPSDVDVDDKGNVYVPSLSEGGLLKLSADGQVISVWGDGFPDPGDIEWAPTGVAVGPGGFIYVVDAGHTCIQKFTQDGQYVTHWGAPGAGDGEFQFWDEIEGATGEGWNVDTVVGGRIAVDQAGSVYVTDTVNNRVQKWTPAASGGYEFYTAWGGYGSGNGQFDRPIGIEVDSNGNVFVVDTFNNRVQKFTSDGVFLAAWGSFGQWGNMGIYDPAQGIMDGLFFLDNRVDGGIVYGNGITVDASGNVYVVDVFNARIQQFTNDGNYLAQWGTWGNEAGEFTYPTGIAVSRNGHIYVGEIGNQRLQKFSPDFQYLTHWGSTGADNGRFNTPNSLTVDSDGFVYVSDRNNWRVQKFNDQGQFVYSLDDGPFWAPVGVVTDSYKNLLVAANKGDESGEYSRIYKFDSSGNLITSFGDRGSGDGEFNFSWAWVGVGMAVDSADNLYVADNLNHRIQKWKPYTATADSGYYFYTAWGSYGSGDGQFIFPENLVASQIVIDSTEGAGVLYVTDPGNVRVHKYDLDGNLLGLFPDWSSPGEDPIAMARDAAGNFFIGTHEKIKVFDPGGTYTGFFSERGVAPGQVSTPFAMAFGPANGKLYVADTFNNRVQVFKPVTEIPGDKAIIVAGGGPFAGNNLWSATQANANFAYRTLTYQGFTKNSIYYLSADMGFDLDGNGSADDVDADATIANLQEAITAWATDATDLVIYLVDHGGAGTFRMSGIETLAIADLATWLNNLQTTISGTITVVYDACESGSFLTGLTPPPGYENKRVVMTSTSPGESAYFISQGTISFSNSFWTHTFNGQDVGTAYSLTTAAMGYATPYQHPLLDANGNGAGNEPADSAAVLGVSIGNGTEISGAAPVIGTVSAAQTINDTSSALLFADNVMDDDGIARVWAVIRPPDYNQGGIDNTVQELPAIDLLPVGGDRYEFIYEYFSLPGTYQVAIYARDRIGNTSVPKTTTVSVNNPLLRKAIIVAGSWQDDLLWPSIANNIGLAYRALSFQGYSDDDISLLSPQAITGLTVDGVPTRAGLADAITNWAGSNTQDLVLYLVGNSGGQKFKLNQTERLAGGELDAWLDTLQATMTGTVTLIYDADQAGGFLPYLVPPVDRERILIASAAGNESANFLAQGDISFSSFFWRQVLNGASVRDAFVHARKAITFLTDSQTPLLDDNGNGIGNEKTAGSVDGLLARYYSLGVGIMLAGDEPLIGSVSPAYTLTGGAVAADIWAYSVTTTGSIDTVWAVIMPPAAYQDSFSETASVSLAYSAASGRYEGSYSGFTALGIYTVAFYARDTMGNISMPVTTTVVQTEGPDVYEDDDTSALAKVIFVNDLQPQVHNFHAAGDADWLRFHAVPGVLYEIAATGPGSAADVDIELFDDPAGAAIGSTVAELNFNGDPDSLSWSAPTDSSYTDGIYYIKITNGVTGTPGPNTGYQLFVFRPTAPDLGIIQGIIYSGLDLSAVSGAVITAGLGSAISLADGVFQLNLEPGAVNLAGIFPGFAAADAQIQVVAGQTARVELAILPAGIGDLNGDLETDLADAILVMQIITGNAPAYTVSVGSDISSNGRVGIEEAVYILQEVSGVRP